jgi:hypothetical protein
MKPAFLAFALIAAAPAFVSAAPAFAQDGAIAADTPLYDAEGKRVGLINRVAEQKWVKVIYKDHFVTIGWDQLKVEDGRVVTSLTRREIGRLKG